MDLLLKTRGYMTACIKRECSNKTCPEYDVKTSSCNCHKHLPHLIKPEYVGSESALEMVEGWYKAIRKYYGPEILYTNNVQDIERLLTVDAFRVELTQLTY